MLDVALTAFDRAVMVASRRPRNFAPDRVTVTLHTSEGALDVEGRVTESIARAPGFPQLLLSVHKFDPATVTAFAWAFVREVARADGALILTVHASAPGRDSSVAYAWGYDLSKQVFGTVPGSITEPFFHEDTTVLTSALDEAPYSSVSALSPESVPDDLFLTGVIGLALTALLETGENHRVAREVYGILTKVDAPQTARAWLSGRNPQLDDDNPLLAICEGRGAAVVTAAHSHARGENAN